MTSSMLIESINQVLSDFSPTVNYQGECMKITSNMENVSILTCVYLIFLADTFGGNFF